jgi:hypothetical protein
VPRLYGGAGVAGMTIPSGKLIKAPLSDENFDH